MIFFAYYWAISFCIMVGAVMGYDRRAPKFWDIIWCFFGIVVVPIVVGTMIGWWMKKNKAFP